MQVLPRSEWKTHFHLPDPVDSNTKIKNQTRLTCKVKFDDNSIDLMKAEDDNNESMLAL